MATSRILLDSGYLIALAHKLDANHQTARKFAQNIPVASQVVIDVAFTEVTYGIRKLVGKPAEIAAIRLYAMANYAVVAVTKSDLLRVHTIMAQYPQFDFVDCCILAIAERENITRICTFDRRDFETFKPTHCDYLELLP
jgi:uncharacterized protein